jgi:PadR family transcriptional regulator, regulatory protein PadR
MSLGEIQAPRAHKSLLDAEHERFGRSAVSFILIVLAESPSYGYEIRRRLEEFGYQRATSDPGALYRLLRELEAAGSISSTWDVAGTGPARRYYALTQRGRDELQGAAAHMRAVKQRAERFLELYAARQPTVPA